MEIRQYFLLKTEGADMSLVGNNMLSLFPNIQSKTTGKIVREESERSPLVIKGFNYKLDLKYIAMNKEYTAVGTQFLSVITVLYPL